MGYAHSKFVVIPEAKAKDTPHKEVFNLEAEKQILKPMNNSPSQNFSKSGSGFV